MQRPDFEEEEEIIEPRRRRRGTRGFNPDIWKWIGIALGVAALGVMLYFALPKTNSSEIVHNVSTRVSGGTLSVSANDADYVYLRYGHYDAVTSELEADQVSNKPLNATFSVKYNGEYTMTVGYHNGETETRYIAVTDNDEPIRLRQESGVIFIDAKNNYRVDTIGYCYGLRLGDTYAKYINLDPTALAAKALGNGWHTFRVFATDEMTSKTYYLAIEVGGCTEPSVIALPTAVGVFSYGFDVTDVVYAPGAYSDWTTLNESTSAICLLPNCTVDIEDFEEGLYTFGFRSAKQVWLIPYRVTSGR